MSKIAWTEQTWNPIVGCSKVSPGCDNCYAEKMAKRLASMQVPGYRSVTFRLCGDGMGNEWNDYPGWNGRTSFIESALRKPLRRWKPTMYFVCSMSDLFHEDTPDAWIDRIFAAMALRPQHTFQVLTKRADRMSDYVNGLTTVDGARRFEESAGGVGYNHRLHNKVLEYRKGNPLLNVWLGVTAENQEQAEKRIPVLQNIPAAVRFVSVEPMLGPIDLAYACFNGADSFGTMPGIDWVICGCESGSKRRPMNPLWATDLLEQCQHAGVRFFMKQMQDYEGRVLKDLSAFPEWLQVREFPKGAGND